MNRNLILLILLLHTILRFGNGQVFSPFDVIGGDTCIFNSSCEFIVIDTTLPNNLWQIGKPSKMVIDTAYMGTRAIITDSITSYDTNSISSFTIQLVHIGTRMHELIFWHKYETDESNDGGYIEMSYDMGETWTNIMDVWSYPLFYSLVYVDNLYSIDDSIIGGIIGFNGSSDGWIKSSISWDALTDGGPIDERVNQDTTLLRFTFVSDSILDNKDGWCIDNIVHLLYESLDFLKSLNKEHSIILYPNPGFDLINVESQIPLSAIDIYSVTGCKVARIDNPSGDIPIGSLPRGIYSVVFLSNNQIITIEKFIKL